ALAFEACALALALASPVLLVRALVDVLLASLGRGPEPAAGMLAALLPGLRVVLALLVLGAAWSSYPEAFAAGL
ncbi:MAG: hypothetical protein KC457_19775, partial [Myxococcales bacterium]|nr:hypothetical protein [Myxococcales bacterium]